MLVDVLYKRVNHSLMMKFLSMLFMSYPSIITLTLTLKQLVDILLDCTEF